MANGTQAAVTEAARLNEIGFPEFTAKLITDTFDALVSANMRQTEAYVELLTLVSKSLTQFINDTKDDIGGELILQFLARVLPDASSDVGTKVKSGGALTDEEATLLTDAQFFRKKAKITMENLDDRDMTRGVRIRPYTGGDCDAAEGGSAVEYSPWLQGPCSHVWTRVNKNRGVLPHEVLFHELVHALRDAAGHGNSLAPLSGGLAGYQNTEELIAVVVTNVFMTDPTNKRADRVGLRRDHGFGKLAPDLSGSLEFFASSHDAFPRIEQFCHEDAWFAQRLAETKATFNPIAAYFHDQANARSKSSSVSALVRDVWPRPSP